MAGLREAIEDFRKKRLSVYKADPTQIVRDANAAMRAAQDHVGRCLFELFQNSDDAKATRVHVRVTQDALYFADNGDGLCPQAVQAISGTDFSDKPEGAIGRKGIGFKAVYEVSATPAVLTVDGEGLRFSPEEARGWLREHLGPAHDKVPYQWLPFFASRAEAEVSDPVLRALADFETVVRLRFHSPEPCAVCAKEAQSWGAWWLLPFNHVTSVEFRTEGSSYELSLKKGADRWILTDSRTSDPSEWRVLKRDYIPPDDVLTSLGQGDRERAKKLAFLVATPVNQEGIIRPLEDFGLVHVFYPTEEQAPIRVLLHAEFLVKSDRTALMPIDGSPFNAWVGDQLAALVAEFVQGCYSPQEPGAYLRLLVPFNDRETHPVAKTLWNRIAKRAHDMLPLPDGSGEPVISLADARMLSVSVATDKARQLLENTPAGGGLVHRALDGDEDARAALRALEVQQIKDEDMLQAIAADGPALAPDHEWVWTAWEWLAVWTEPERRSQEHKARLDRVKELAIVPLAGALKPLSDLPATTITWRTQEAAEDLPHWMPLAFVEDWFRDRVVSVPPVRNLLNQLGIKESGKDVLKNALGNAIKAYWQNRHGDPRRFLTFLEGTDWPEEEKRDQSLARCPIPARIGGKPDSEWVEAGQAYFGREWGDDLLETLYEGADGIAWALPSGGEADREQRLVEWLGCMLYPRVTPQGRKRVRASEVPTNLTSWVNTLRREPTRDGHINSLSAVQTLDRIEPACLDPNRAAALVSFLALHWRDYYEAKSRTTANIEGPRGGYRDPERVMSAWYWQVREQLVPPVASTQAEPAPLCKCWLPDKHTSKAIGQLLPVIDLDAFGEHGEKVSQWLRDEVRLRSHLEELTIEEWKTLLSERIPSLVTAEEAMTDSNKRDQVAKWYEACLQSLEEQEGVRHGAMKHVPVLCRKGEAWDYVKEEQRWIADDEELRRAFQDDLWHVFAREAQRAEWARLFGLNVLSKSVESALRWDGSEVSAENLTVRLRDVIPYVFAWRRSRAAKEDPDKLRSLLTSLRVFTVETLEAVLRLKGLERAVERRYGAEEDRLLITRAGSEDEALTYLAGGLAEALGTRSDADLCENLFRCGGAEARKAKLLDRGVPADLLDQYVREFRQVPEETVLVGSVDGDDEEPPRAAPKTAALPKAAPEHHPPAATPERPRLKDPQNTKIEVGVTPPTPTGRPRGGGDGGGTGSTEAILTHEDRLKVEKAGRQFAERRLKEAGYEVQQMLQANPGFDILARLASVELRIEIKAHSGEGRIVELTARELREYDTWRGEADVRWELWNVENLAGDPEVPVHITRYADIPDEALQDKALRLDLAKCGTAVESPSDSE